MWQQYWASVYVITLSLTNGFLGNFVSEAKRSLSNVRRDPPPLNHQKAIPGLEKSLMITKLDSSVSNNLKSFSFSDLKNATRNFRSETMLGEGGFGCVFKGWIDANTLSPAKPGSGMVVAIKKLKPESFQGHKEWLVCGLLFWCCLRYLFECLVCFAVNLVLFHWQAEVNYLGQLHHENLVKLIGYCCESDNRLLVYEFMPKGSLENHLFRSKSIFFKGPAFFDFWTSLPGKLYVW